MLELIERGGPVIWPLLLTSVITLATIIERSIFLLRFKLKLDPLKRNHFSSLISENKLREAINFAHSSDDPVLQAISHSYDENRESFLTRFQKSARIVLARIHKGIPVLDTAITIAPLLGLLGTVVGLIHSFYSLGESEITAPIAITGGISEALIATAFGLAIAIVALIPYNILNELEENIRVELEALGSAVEEYLSKQQ
jgi:biopolymer transport protein ExbB